MANASQHEFVYAIRKIDNVVCKVEELLPQWRKNKIAANRSWDQ